MAAWVNPFQTAGRWWRGNLHCHTTRSDGAVGVEERCAQYRAAGYDFIVITDHGIAGPVLAEQAAGLLVVPGVELHPDNPYGGDIYHIVGVNVRESIAAERLSPVEVLRAVTAQGGVAIMVHPYWSGHQLSDYTPLAGGYVALEIYNHLARRLNGTHNAELLWDAHLDRVGAVWGTAGDDAHGGPEDIGGGWVMVRADRLTPESICAALRSGAFYATQGPTIEGLDVATVGGAVEFSVRCSPAARVRFKGRTYTGRVVEAPTGAPLRDAEYRCTGEEKYIRVEVIDQAGRSAWTNPVYLAQVSSGARD
ncbi:MAG TPA: CehA/McbA family metallohydrolase [Phycisphaerae bacterium]|nr:CehA/McbA family metallohydrolase [Phycisphaerae bacterium]HNU47018.1 CehA/McbA family metallohydrolase [Phycisphaerae bacterium]